MPPKYSDVKKQRGAPPSPLRKSPNRKNKHGSQHVDRPVAPTVSTSTKLERAIARIILLRYEQDIARLFSTRLYCISLVHLPTFVMRCAALAGPGWVAQNADADEIKDFFRAAITMDMRQAGERVATKSVLWSYTALRHFAMSKDIPICKTRGLHSNRLLPHYDALKAHLDTLEALPPPAFAKPPHLASLQEGEDALEEACNAKYATASPPPEWGPQSEWREKVRLGYEKLSQTLWRVAREFDVRGYGMVLRDKLTTKWCDCGCSTDHLGEVCERTVREDEEENGVRLGKQREWDGRGSGIIGWETEEEEDIWELAMDFGASGVGLDPPPDDAEDNPETDMTIGELMEWRYIKAEREKEEGNTAFRKGDYVSAVKHYEAAYGIEGELPHYQLNLAAAHLKLNHWMEAEAACTKALSQHRSVKGYFRRAKARKMLGRTDEAIRDLRAILKLQPTNAEAVQELVAMLPPVPSDTSNAQQSSATAERIGIPKPKKPKPLPFARTRMDDRRLKFVHVPTPAAEPGLLGFGSGTGGCCCHHNHQHSCAPQKLKGKAQNRGAAGIGSASKREKEQALEAEMLKVLEAMKVDNLTVSVVAPGWDRYVVRRAD
ncbi:hypothetical protein MKEN_00507900 [Mycena kentingensis (nom. inval.)]|nr:hypothetical protein MKEN_00507900 [Mycena kentingensis (nom. inval.)]